MVLIHALACFLPPATDEGAPIGADRRHDVAARLLERLVRDWCGGGAVRTSQAAKTTTIVVGRLISKECRPRRQHPHKRHRATNKDTGNQCGGDELFRQNFEFLTLLYFVILSF